MERPDFDSPLLQHISPDLRSLAVPVSVLHSDPDNVRLHGERNRHATRSSLAKYGQRKPLVVNERTMTVEAGNGTLECAKDLGWEWIAISREDDDAVTAAGYAVADNRTAELAEWDYQGLSMQLNSLAADGEDLSELGFNTEELEAIAAEHDPPAGGDDPGGKDPGASDPPAEPVSQRGEIYDLGPHRLMCGDSTDRDQVLRLVGTEKAELMHADPPYGMGKESDGVENDNLYNDKLQDFNVAWWGAWRPSLVRNASSYIWGNPEPLWSFWLLHLARSEELTLCNEIVWNKGSGFGQGSSLQRSYSINTERCLFFMLGRREFGNVNKDAFPEQYQPLLDYLLGELKESGLTRDDVHRICGVKMFSHWFSRSQWTLIPEKHYAKLQAEAKGGAFLKPHGDLVRMRDRARREGDGGAPKAYNDARAYFDNTHDNMNEVWDFPRVSGDERYGHATPKPVEACERMIRSSAPKGGLVLEPFGGSGSTLIAAARAGRRCYTMEISPAYCDVIRKRWTAYADAQGIEAGTGALRD